MKEKKMLTDKKMEGVMNMFVSAEDKERCVMLLESEINEIIDELERVPYTVYKWMNYDAIIKKLKQEEPKHGKEKTKSKKGAGKKN
jgi:hypothetical protein